MDRSKPRQIVWRPYLEKNPSKKRASRVAQGVGPEFNPSTTKKKKKKKKKTKINYT
jgi:hypothetical protein